MFEYVYAMTTNQKTRFVLSVLGTALCVLLMLFLLAVYQGVADGSLDYIRDSDPDLWVLHKNANNILRGQSVLLPQQGERIARIKGVASVSPILLLLSRAEMPEGWASVYLVGYDPGSEQGGPPEIVAGRSVGADGEIVVDQAFAAKWDVGIGDTLTIQDSRLEIVGLSGGTNAFVIQYAFVSLKRAHALMDLVPIVSCFLVDTVPGRDRGEVIGQIRRALPSAAVYPQSQFVANNTQEMQAGFLPFVLTIAVIGAIVLTTLLSLLLSISILEARPDFATVKILGAPRGYLPRLVAGQSLFTAASGVIVGQLLFLPLVALVRMATPEVAVRPTAMEAGVVTAGVLIMSLVSAAAAMHRLRKIHALEALA